jgi:hypothetical protein
MFIIPLRSIINSWTTIKWLMLIIYTREILSEYWKDTIDFHHFVSRGRERGRMRSYAAIPDLRTYLNQPISDCHFLSSLCHQSDHQRKHMNASLMKKYIIWIVTQHNLMLTLTCRQEKSSYSCHFIMLYHLNPSYRYIIDNLD